MTMIASASPASSLDRACMGNPPAAVCVCVCVLYGVVVLYCMCMCMCMV